MNNKIIKGIIIVLAVGGILALVFLSMKRVSPSNIKKVEPLDFVGYVEQSADKNIGHAGLADAGKAYNNLYAEVSTEAAIQCRNAAGEDTTLLSDSQAERCYEMLFEAYFPKLSSRADNLFSASVWSENEREFIYQESMRLSKMNGTSSHRDSLENYIKYVSGYNDAMRLLSNAGYCSSSTSYNNLRNNAGNYCQWPWSNVSTIGTSFKSTISEKAKTSWLRSIRNKVNTFSNRDKSYYINKTDPISELNNDYSHIHEAIVDYSTTFSADLSSEVNTLNSAYTKQKDAINNANKPTIS